MSDVEERKQVYALGEPVPASPHAVCLHLPTLRDVIGYEEKDPRVMVKIYSGYPRFVLHPFIVELAGLWQDLHGLDERLVCLVTSGRSASELCAYIGDETADWVEVDGGAQLFHCEDNEENRTKSRAFLQHTGCSVSSRYAEDRLVERGRLADRFPEEARAEGAGERVRRQLAETYRINRSDAVLLCNSGMNAFYSVFKAIREWGLESGRALWIQWGWLYLDTTRILERLRDGEGATRFFNDVRDHEALELFLEQNGSRVAGLVTEVPTNPLMQTADLAWLRRMADRHGFALVIDPSMASAGNVEVLPHADVVVQSLSKYTASAGDVIMGAVVFNRDRPLGSELLPSVVVNHEPPYTRDLARLAVEIERTASVLKQLNATAALVASFLEEHPQVRRVYWAYSRATRSRYEAICRWPIGPGSVITFEVDGPMEAFYDGCPLVKGPSFGTEFSILCPYIYLAHYDLVVSSEGRQALAEAGLKPELLRLSVGMEPPEQIMAALEEGFARLKTSARQEEG